MNYHICNETMKEVYRILLREGPMTAAQIRERTGIPKERITSLLFSMKYRNMIRRKTSGPKYNTIWEAI